MDRSSPRVISGVVVKLTREAIQVLHRVTQWVVIDPSWVKAGSEREVSGLKSRDPPEWVESGSSWKRPDGHETRPLPCEAGFPGFYYSHVMDVEVPFDAKVASSLKGKTFRAWRPHPYWLPETEKEPGGTVVALYGDDRDGEVSNGNGISDGSGCEDSDGNDSCDTTRQMNRAGAGNNTADNSGRWQKHWFLRPIVSVPNYRNGRVQCGNQLKAREQDADLNQAAFWERAGYHTIENHPFSPNTPPIPRIVSDEIVVRAWPYICVFTTITVYLFTCSKFMCSGV